MFRANDFIELTWCWSCVKIRATASSAATATTTRQGRVHRRRAPHRHLRRRPPRCPRRARDARPQGQPGLPLRRGRPLRPRERARHAGRLFEALRYDQLREDWFWHSLPLPPYVRDPGYTRSSVKAHTAAAGGRIWTYTQDAGTYSLDTRRSSWRKEGDWALPFVGKAEHVPAVCGSEGLCFGFASISGPLCAVDLATATAESPPEVRGVWEEFRLPGTGGGAPPTWCTSGPARCASSGSSALSLVPPWTLLGRSRTVSSSSPPSR
ncbi:hypothetical protein ZWY2020_016143 [Hordeum vulgare]|nr:hypothetical protein ZWY2020_016143 [Hordeum vulgare]